MIIVIKKILYSVTLNLKTLLPQFVFNFMFTLKIADRGRRFRQNFSKQTVKAGWNFSKLAGICQSKPRQVDPKQTSPKMFARTNGRKKRM